jgi:hypothetical protein
MNQQLCAPKKESIQETWSSHDMRNEIKQSKQTTKKLRKTYQASKRKKGAKKTNYIEENGWKKEEQAECTQKEQTSSVLCSSHESKAKELGKGGGKAMKSDGKRWSARGPSVTNTTLIPVQTPMRTLGSGLSV